MAIKRFYEPEEELNFDESPINGGRYLRQWNMTVPLGHSKEKDVRVFFETTRQKIRAKLSSDLQDFQRFKFMKALRIKLYTEKPIMPSHRFTIVASSFYSTQTR